MNNSAGLNAVLYALRDHPDVAALTIQVDSTYARDCATTWRARWQRNGMRTAKKKTVANADIIVVISEAVDARPGRAEFTTVPGQDTGNELPLNTAADSLANDAARDSRRPSRDSRPLAAERRSCCSSSDSGILPCSCRYGRSVKENGARDDKRMRLRYPGSCRVCGVAIAAGTLAIYERSSRTVRCLSHDRECVVVPGPGGPVIESVPELIQVGAAGASARREFDRRRQDRGRRIRSRHPRIGGLILALTDDPQTTKAWDLGALGEQRLGGRLDEIAGETLRVLHDRRIPRSRGNIDHLAVTGTGVWVIDAKKYRGRPERKVVGGLRRPRVEKLLVDGRDRTRLVDGVEKQVDLVRDIVGGELPIQGVLCFVDADWPLLGAAFRVRDVDVVWPKKLYTKLREPGPFDAHTIGGVHRRLATTLRPA